VFEIFLVEFFELTGCIASMKDAFVAPS